MGDTRNLVPFNMIPADRHRELSRRGGKASGEARRAMRKRIDDEKVAQAARDELSRDNVKLLAECARILKSAKKIAGL